MDNYNEKLENIKRLEEKLKVYKYLLNNPNNDLSKPVKNLQMYINDLKNELNNI
jgi:hypothetical protein